METWIVFLVSSLSGGIIGILFGIIFSTISILFMSSAKNGVLGEHEYTISPEGLHEKTRVNEGLSKWEGMSKIKMTGPYLLFQVSGYLYHIVPARSFDATEDFKKYALVSMRFWKQANDITMQEEH